jgi:hypothetical protein
VNIDELWLHAQLAAIGETLEDEDDNEVMGVVVNVRKGFYRIGLWTRTVGKSKGDNASGRDVLMKIGSVQTTSWNSADTLTVRMLVQRGQKPSTLSEIGAG